MKDFRVTTFNTEGISDTKAQLLSEIQTDILCLQETHKETSPPDIPGMHRIIHNESSVYGSAIYARDKSIIINSDKEVSDHGQETLTVETTNMTIISIYKPPASPFQWPKIENQSP